jgi:hypothetical protein
MSPVLTASVEAPPRPMERPGFFVVGWLTFQGYLFTAILGLVFVLVASLSGIGLVHEPGSGRGLFYHYDVWSWAAEVCVALIVVTVTSLLVGHLLRTRLQWEAGFGTTFLTLLFAGYAPALAITPLYGATGVVSLAIATVILRWRLRPSGAEPRTALGQLPPRARRPAAIALAIVGPAMAAYVLGYAVTHPLVSGDSGDPANSRIVAHEPGELLRFTLGVQNGGDAPVTDLSIVRVEGSPALQFVRAGVPVSEFSWDGRDAPERHEWPLRPLSVAELHTDGGPSDIELELRQGRTCPPGIARLDALWVRYTVLGMRHEQRLPLVDGPSVRCR